MWLLSHSFGAYMFLFLLGKLRGVLCKGKVKVKATSYSLWVYMGFIYEANYLYIFLIGVEWCASIECCTV